MAILFGFVPWIVFWILVGNAPVLVAAAVALASAVAAFAVGRSQRAPGRSLEIGAVATFVLLTILSVLLDEVARQQWLPPLSYLGLLVATAVGAATGRPFVREFAAEGQPPHVLESQGFQSATARLTWIWVAAFAAMTVASLIAPIAGGGAELATYFSWVVPVALFVAAVLVTRIRPAELAAGANDAVRKTTFVAYSEAAIDELYYLAQEHANRLVGAGEVAYDVKVGDRVFHWWATSHGSRGRPPTKSGSRAGEPTWQTVPMAQITLKGNPINTVGELPAIGAPAPGFTLTGTDLGSVSSDQFNDKAVLLNIFPSVDTPVCAASVRTFNERAAASGASVLCVSNDLPFAQKRFCGAEDIENVTTASGFRDSFGQDYGVTIVDGPMAGLLGRAVVVIGADGKVVYTELVPEIAQEPDYDAALAALA